MSPEIQPPAPPRSPWQLFYGAVHHARWQWFARRAERLPCPVISVGNLHWGGAGKTPMVAAIAEHLRDQGWTTAILSRGYRGRAKGVQVVSSGDGPLLGPLVAGDEPVLLAGTLRGVAVLVGRDRARAGRHALERLEPPPEVFVLDDGFSHLRLFRDIDLLVFPGDDPYAGGRLLPSGRLREPLSAVRRADAAVLTEAGEETLRAFVDSLRPFGFEGPGFSCAVRAEAARRVDGEPLAAGAAVVAVAAIARPERFLASVREAGFRIAEAVVFSDHHRYPEASLRRIERAWSQSAADAVLTTGKDRVKLLGRLDAPLAELPIRAELETTFWRWLDRRLHQQRANET